VDPDDALAIAEHLLANVGIVPFGMDVAMTEGYRPFFKEMAQRQGTNTV